MAPSTITRDSAQGKTVRSRRRRATVRRKFSARATVLSSESRGSGRSGKAAPLLRLLLRQRKSNRSDSPSQETCGASIRKRLLDACRLGHAPPDNLQLPRERERRKNETGTFFGHSSWKFSRVPFRSSPTHTSPIKFHPQRNAYRNPDGPERRGRICRTNNCGAHRFRDSGSTSHHT